MIVMQSIGCYKGNASARSMANGTCVAEHAPHRLLSLALGGWCIEGDLPALVPGGLDTMLAMFEKSDDPHKRALIPAEENRPAAKVAFQSLSETAGSQAALKAAVESGIPVLLWLGKKDMPMFRDNAKAAAEASGARYHELEGDHASLVSCDPMVNTEESEAVKLVFSFVVESREKSPDGDATKSVA